ncbi:DUF3343 domain-containing protein [Limosilactobacillus sp.]|jgi:hypothetical protein|uniref:DUF3343 domain-containing protein n=1 Tax=Limosilactobacillus sp. TaxID=2773925 RepID=UPI0035A02625
MEYGLVVFDSTHEAIKTETLAKDNQFHARLIGTPGQIVAGCGLSLRYELDDTVSLRKLLDNNNVSYKGFYHALRNGIKSSYTVIK